MNGGVEAPGVRLQLFRFGNQAIESFRQSCAGIREALLGRKLYAYWLLVGLSERHLALVDSAMQEKPGRELHEARGQPHAFRRISERCGTVEQLRFLAAGTVEICSRLFHKLHAIAKE